jgi:hypothetical protein
MKSPSDSDSAAWGHTVVMSFSDAFWPAFWATAGGVVLGIPSGLQVARFASWLEARDQRRASMARTCSGLDLIQAALRKSSEDLHFFVDRLAQGEEPIAFWRPEQAIWDTLAPVVLPGVSDVRFKARLARCFELTSEVSALFASLNELEEAASGPPPYAAHARRAADYLRRDIQGHCAEVATHIDEVRLEAEKYLATYRPKAGS